MLADYNAVKPYIVHHRRAMSTGIQACVTAILPINADDGKVYTLCKGVGRFKGMDEEEE